MVAFLSTIFMTFDYQSYRSATRNIIRVALYPEATWQQAKVFCWCAILTLSKLQA